MTDEKLKRQEAEAIILKRFEQIKGRPATAEERVELSKRKLLPGKNGVPSLGPLGTGIGFILGGFAGSEGKRGGEFYTPRSVVRSVMRSTHDRTY